MTGFVFNFIIYVFCFTELSEQHKTKILEEILGLGSDFFLLYQLHIVYVQRLVSHNCENIFFFVHKSFFSSTFVYVQFFFLERKNNKSEKETEKKIIQRKFVLYLSYYFLNKITFTL